MEGGIIKGKSGTEYKFEYFDFSSNYATDPPGVYVIANREKKESDGSKSYRVKGVLPIFEEGKPRINKVESTTGYLFYKCKDALEVNEVKDDLEGIMGISIPEVPL